jgi:hypothetical protein
MVPAYHHGDRKASIMVATHNGVLQGRRAGEVKGTFLIGRVTTTVCFMGKHWERCPTREVHLSGHAWGPSGGVGGESFGGETRWET